MTILSPTALNSSFTSSEDTLAQEICRDTLQNVSCICDWFHDNAGDKRELKSGMQELNELTWHFLHIIVVIQVSFGGRTL